MSLVSSWLSNWEEYKMGKGEGAEEGALHQILLSKIELCIQ